MADGLVLASVEALEAGDEFFGEGFAGLGPEEAAGDAAVLFDGEGEGEELLDVLLDALGGFGVERFFFSTFEGPGSVEAEVDADVAVLLVGAEVEVGAEADDADADGLEAPGGIEAGRGRFGDPEAPTHFELVGGVVVELLGGFGDGVFGEGGVGFGGFAAFVVDVDALVDGGFRPVDGIGGGSGDAGELGLSAAFAGDGDELTEHADECVGEGLEPEVREPETEVELVGHEVNCIVPDTAGLRKTFVMRRWTEATRCVCQWNDCGGVSWQGRCCWWA